MVRNLCAAGHDVVVSSRNPERLAGEGWTVVGSPAQAAEGADIVCSIVPDSPEVTEVVHSVMETAAEGSVIVEMSTHSPDTARQLAAECAVRGVAYLDCPVSGGPPGAAAGTLAIWVGGSEEAMDRARPVLDVLGDEAKVRHCGAVGAGLVVKLANNFLGAVNAVASAEALAMAREEGLDPALVAEAVMQGSGANWQLGNLYPQRVFGGDFEPGFALAHMLKDVNAARQVAAALGVDQPVGEAALARLREAVERFGPGVDYGSVARLYGW
jgi:3-hydroxyisobutyrate dehydrogenase-like beta-hydroxyacid dehydrogenase